MFKTVLRAVGAGKVTSNRDSAIRLGAGDDYDWELYNSTYRGEVAKIGKSHTLHLTQDNSLFEEGRLSMKSGHKPMHPNHRLLYETILQLEPRSVTEIGCGGGDHVRNLSLLAPSAKIFGYDRADRQLAFLRERSPHLSDFVRQLDISMPLPQTIPQTEVCYTQAVVMHIQAANSHFVALSNLFRIATEQVVLMENWTRHDFMGDIQMMFDQQMLSWESIHFYFRRAPEFDNSPHLMIVSRQPLPQYETLNRYELLRAA